MPGVSSPRPAYRRNRLLACGQLHRAAILAAVFLFSGCTGFLNHYFQDTVLPHTGTCQIDGLKEPVAVRRDNQGIPFIEAASLDDLAFAMGYVAASDRLSQMIGFKLTAYGRISEIIGEVGLDIDIYMRTLNLRKASKILYNSASERIKVAFSRYSDGVNAYIDAHALNLPPPLRLAGYIPERWEPVDSAAVFALLNLGLGFNLHEEIIALNLARRVGPDKAAWLLPVYPDEPIPVAEAQKLKQIDLHRKPDGSSRLFSTLRSVAKHVPMGIAASNNWAISSKRTIGSASILANDTHLPLSLPSIWIMMHARCPEYDAAGIAIAGIPGIIAGFNGHIAWGMTMVMADTQDLFLEKLTTIDGQLSYLYRGEWHPCRQRVEIFKIKGKPATTITIHETRHGPLLNLALKNAPPIDMLPPRLDMPVGLALSWSLFEEDASLDAFLSLGTANSVENALPLVRQIQAIPLNMVLADRENIAWQVTGRFPIRKNGLGLFPSPGWSGEFDWTGYLDTDSHPFAVNPSSGFVGTANHRSVPPDFPHTLSSSWYYPERSERIEQMILSTRHHSMKTSVAMQLDQFSPFVEKLKKRLLRPPLLHDINQEISRWTNRKRQAKALEALTILKRFNGKMSRESADAALIGALWHTITRNVFRDELGDEDSEVWKAFQESCNLGYSAPADHLIAQRRNSPFWDDIRTKPVESPGKILAVSLADAIELLENRLGNRRDTWQWGNLHTYHWQTEASKFGLKQGIVKRAAMKLINPWWNRGPFPAGGDHTTLNVSAYHIARNFDTWLIPEMRLIVDFSQDEPLIAQNSTGQSDNPATPYYDDGIYHWLEGTYRPFPFNPEHINRQYNHVLSLIPATP